MKIVLATKNQGKVVEIKKLLADTTIELLSLKDVSVDGDVEEDGETYEENAIKKASFVSKRTGLPAIADDSGLEVDALDGKPGLHSARFAGEGASDQDRNNKLLTVLQEIPEEKRGAKFVCATAIVDSAKGTIKTFRGECPGTILKEAKGEAGFGYDPLFYLEEYGKTFAELGSEIKNKISHRALAFKETVKYIRTLKL